MRKSVYSCDNCNSQIETRHHCTVCDDFDLCSSCEQKDGHPHRMEKLESDLAINSREATRKPRKRSTLERCIQSLVHAYQCRDANCALPSCHKMKRVVTHTKICRRKTITLGCPICKQLIGLCCYHTRHCHDDGCLVPYCSNIKSTYKRQQLQQRLQRVQLLWCVYYTTFFDYYFFFIVVEKKEINHKTSCICRTRMAAMRARLFGVNINMR